MQASRGAMGFSVSSNAPNANPGKSPVCFCVQVCSETHDFSKGFPQSHLR
jgi:hypothetical protein